MSFAAGLHLAGRVGATIALLTPPYATALLLLQAARRRADLRLSNGLLITAALALGLGLSAIGFVLWLALPGSDPLHLALVETVALLLAFWLRSGTGAAGAPVFEPMPGGRRPWLALAVGAVVIEASFVFAAVAEARPHGDWDAWAMWNERARFFALDPGHWLDAFRVDVFFHPDYPFLLPAAVARLWTYGAAVRRLEPIVVAALFAAATAGMLFFGLRDRRGRAPAMLAALLLLGGTSRVYGLDSFAHLAATQMADVPIGCYFLASLVLLSGAATERRNAAHLALAGFCLSLAAWTKNEGAAFATIVVLGFALGSRLDRSARGVRETLWLAAGAAPGAAAWLVYKNTLVPSVDLFRGSTAEIVARLAIGDRHAVVAGVLGDVVLKYGAGAYLVAIAAVGLLGIGHRPSWRADWLPLAAVVGLIGVEYLILVMSPFDPDWHARSSIPRLLSQLWPSALFALFLVARVPGGSPEPAFADGSACVANRPRMPSLAVAPEFRDDRAP